jgi:hypothetical protein
MQQHEIDDEVARQTGESLRRIRHHGFSLVEVPPSPRLVRCRRPKTVAWDRLNREQGVALFGESTRAGRSSSHS